jgi:hypothetical protein
MVQVNAILHMDAAQSGGGSKLSKSQWIRIGLPVRIFSAAGVPRNLHLYTEAVSLHGAILKGDFKRLVIGDELELEHDDCRATFRVTHINPGIGAEPTEIHVMCRPTGDFIWNLKNRKRHSERRQAVRIATDCNARVSARNGNVQFAHVKNLSEGGCFLACRPAPLGSEVHVLIIVGPYHVDCKAKVRNHKGNAGMGVEFDPPNAATVKKLLDALAQWQRL